MPRFSPRSLPSGPSDATRTGLPNGRTGPELRLSLSGRRDLNPRPLVTNRDHTGLVIGCRNPALICTNTASR
jgi:hypothetical protein